MLACIRNIGANVGFLEEGKKLGVRVKLGETVGLIAFTGAGDL